MNEDREAQREYRTVQQMLRNGELKPNLDKMQKNAANMLHLLVGIVKEYDRTRSISLEHAYAARRVVNRIYNRHEDD
jgi:hypothetical protein